MALQDLGMSPSSHHSSDAADAEDAQALHKVNSTAELSTDASSSIDGHSSGEEKEVTSSSSDVRRSPATVSGSSGEALAQELLKWSQRRSAQHASRRPSLLEQDLSISKNAWERVELKVAAYYDRPFGWFFSFVYDVLQLSSGRDKFCAVLQGYAKFVRVNYYMPDSERFGMYRGIEDSLSDGRKIFRLFKEFREVYKIRRGFHRFEQGIEQEGCTSSAALCGALDVLAHTASFFFYFFDNLLWAASVGIVRAKEVPKWQKGMWQGWRRNGRVIDTLGGVRAVKRMKNYTSIWRLSFAMLANAILLKKAVVLKAQDRFEGPDDARLFHVLEIAGMAASFRVLQARLGFKALSESRCALLDMLAALVGLWSNWRKVCRDKCGTKKFVPTATRRRSLMSTADLAQLKLSHEQTS
eukprot:gnl/TRDRNA2_/TRDRNA2_196126_c0_seq1.p1 gnl/TRDRNA2_/TRDRNA2_196126_c0~~gnl/TRDRNA2_/TRDRNA2_196126_c0_seq1.p1  ORF type:complete len:412 (+),score=93.44 gnl/TRDRNA2_/TRDRNA2_196126_c0_seq1:75-1310(+)